MVPIKITVLISGNGSNLQALIDACQNGDIPSANIVRVISNREKAFGLERARYAGIPTAYVNLVKYKKQHPATDQGVQDAKERFFQDLAPTVLKDEPDIVVCAGWMLIVTESFLDQLTKASIPIINLHPALPGAFNGINAIERAYEAFHEGKVNSTGVMIHYVIKEVDEGTPILTKKLPMIEGESLSDLEARIHNLEHKAIVEGTKIAIDQLKKPKDDLN